MGPHVVSRLLRAAAHVTLGAGLLHTQQHSAAPRRLPPHSWERCLRLTAEQETNMFSDTLVANGIPTPGKKRELLQGSRKPPRKAAPCDQLLSVRWQFTRFP